MIPFTTLTATAAPLPVENVDTDMIIPKQFLTTIKRTGLKEGLFYEMRYDAQGNYNADFILHREPYTHAQILIAGSNFGCGSSREHAPWALLDFGIRCVIAPSFADIFFNNCFKNGILPIVLPTETVNTLMEYAADAANQFNVDLEKQTIHFIETSRLNPVTFSIDPFRKRCLLEGLDDIGLSLEKLPAIDAFETAQKQHMPWLYTA